MEEDEVRPAKAIELSPEEIEYFSIEALEERISALQAEVERLRAAIGAKTSARGAADSVFKS